MPDVIRSALLLLVLLNPFLVIVYLVDVVEKLDGKRFAQVILRASAIASALYVGTVAVEMIMQRVCSWIHKL